MIFSLRYDPLFAVTHLRRGIRASQTLTSPAGKENDGVRRRSIQPWEEQNPLYFESYSSPEELLRRFVQHEAGHFLAAYLLGIIPNDYILPSVKAMKTEKVIRGCVELPFADFMRKVDKVYISRNNRHKGERTHKAIKSKESFPDLKRFACVTLGGIVAEHLVFGGSIGGCSDIEMLYGVYSSLGFTADEAYSLTKWGALNTVLMLHRHGEARSSLAEAMAQGETIGFCIDTIENNLNLKQI